MKISELPQEIKEKALEYQRNSIDKSFNKNTDVLIHAFDWSKTLGGHTFWKKWYGKEPSKPESLIYTFTNEIKEEYKYIQSGIEREKEFELVVNKTLEDLKQLLIIKGKEYRRNNNPYHNFERGAEMTDFTREEILQGFLRKHLISIEDMRKDNENFIFPTKKQVDEKYNDILVYFLIEKAMMMENSNK